jgi:hypothetical protein
MKAPSPAPPPPAEPEVRSAPEVPRDRPVPQRRPLLGQRRRFVVHWPSQMRSAVIVTSVALVLVTLLNVSLHTTRVQSERAVAGQSTELQQLLEAHARFELLLAILASLIFLVGVFVVTILETHKTAGAAFHIGRELERVRDGFYGIEVRLRRGDNLGNLAASFNEMTRTLAERTVLHAEELEHAASEADRIESPPEAAALARALREMADERRRMIAAPDA